MGVPNVLNALLVVIVAIICSSSSSSSDTCVLLLWPRDDTEKLPFPLSVRCLHILAGSEAVTERVATQAEPPLGGTMGSDFRVGRSVVKQPEKPLYAWIGVLAACWTCGRTLRGSPGGHWAALSRCLPGRGPQAPTADSLLQSRAPSLRFFFFLLVALSLI